MVGARNAPRTLVLVRDLSRAVEQRQQRTSRLVSLFPWMWIPASIKRTDIARSLVDLLAAHRQV